MSDLWKEVVAEWRGDMGFVGNNEFGSNIQMGIIDGKPGIKPMELMLLGLAGCTGIDVVMILGKKHQKLKDFKIHVRGKRAEKHPKVYTQIEVTYLFWGENLDTKAIEHAIQLSQEKYCSASNMLGAVAQISSSYRINPSGEDA